MTAINQPRRLFLNVISSVIQILASTVLLLLLYRYLILIIGVERLGVWSLVMAIGSATQIANLGLTGAITKFVAEYDAQRLNQRILVAVQTSAISIGVLGVVLSLLAYPLGLRYLHFAIPAQLESEAQQILPLALGAFWLSLSSSTYRSALHGLQRYAESNAVLIADSVLQFLLCMLFVSRYGLIGLVWARLICNVLSFIAVVSLARRYIPELPWMPLSWSGQAFREMARYAGGLQIISVLVIFSDPVTKGLLSRFGSLTAVGYYEMADKLIKALRALLVSANQVTLPKFAMLGAGERERERHLFQISQRLNVFFAMPAFALLMLAAPVVSGLWLGRQEPPFVLAMEIVGIGWLANVLALPSYFASLGSGAIRLNLLSHLVLASSNVLLGWILCVWMNATGVMVGWALALVLSSCVLIVACSKQYGFSWSIVIPSSQRLLSAVSLLAIGVALAGNVIVYPDHRWGEYASVPLWNWVLIAVMSTAIVIAAYYNPARVEVVSSLAVATGRSRPGTAT